MTDKKKYTTKEIWEINEACDLYGNLLKYTLKSSIQSTGEEGYSEGHIKMVKRDLDAAVHFNHVPLIYGIVKAVEMIYQNYLKDENNK